MAHCTLSHIEIPSPDLQKAMAFYSEVFGWKSEMVMEKYAVFSIGDTGTGGGFDASLTPAPEKTGPQLVISVDSIEKVLPLIRAKGGTVTKEKTDIGDNYGFYACFTDPNGNHMQVHAMK